MSSPSDPDNTTSVGPEDEETEYGVGWLFFAGTILGLAGLGRLIDALWAFRTDRVSGDLEGGLLGTTVSNYGWLWIVTGVILIWASFAIFFGSQFARWFGMIAGGVMAVSSFFWMPFYPVWSLVYTLSGFLVLYALAVHGGRDAAVISRRDLR